MEGLGLDGLQLQSSVGSLEGGGWKSWLCDVSREAELRLVGQKRRRFS